MFESMHNFKTKFMITIIIINIIHLTLTLYRSTYHLPNISTDGVSLVLTSHPASALIHLRENKFSH